MILLVVIVAAYFAFIYSSPVKEQQLATTSEKPTEAVTSNESNHEVNADNPFFKPYDTPYGIPPFDKISNNDYMPAFKAGMEQQNKEIAAIVNNPEPATFANTIEAMEWSGSLLNKVANVFFNLTGSNTNPEMQKLQQKIGPMLSKHSDNIALNPKLFERVKAVYNQKEKLNLSTDQKKLLKDSYRSFVRGGANLNEKDQNTLRQINEKLSKLSIQFSENVLAETNDYEMVVDDKAELAGLPDDIIAAAAATAKKKGHEGKWVFTTQRVSKTPFLTYSTNRALKKKLFHAYTHRGDNGNKHDNNNIVSEISSLRYQKAQLLGYNTYADYILEKQNARNAKNVYALMDKVWKPTLAKAIEERDDIQKMANDEGGNFKVEASDWRYYSNKIRKQRYDFDESVTRPYFSLDNTLKGAFFVAYKLYGITFKERTDLPKYHKDVRTFEVYQGDKVIGIYLTDHFVRASKRGGAWMNSFRKQYRHNGKNVLPIIVNVLNFPRPSGDEPALLTFDQASTLFHEFGHALHGLLSDGHYISQTGTSVPRDYVEFPSQFMEYWFSQPVVLKEFAKHYKTGEVIPDELLAKIKRASKFNQGFLTGEYMAAAYLDMAWNTLTTADLQEPHEFEKKAMEKIGLIPEILPRYRSTYFSHIFSGGYAAGYYSYIWTDVLAADAFEAFKENGLFNPETAKKFRKYIVSAGGTDDTMTLYRKFRGKDPEITPLLKSRGLIQE